ncbi:thioredoxin-related transmembrane protein 2-like [Physella acuta]|uniref:thioredoxin-related transmembrane protein 2-like n=1 Tax=Physella acuta TaxID=109671 RepID=UPI0027DD3FB8|nr:thioredoxin-related transmembrane protein 2-like [Physella acuta]
MMAVLGELRVLLAPHYITDIILATLYFILKSTPKVCNVLFHSCTLEMREWEWLTFLACIVVLKNRRQASIVEYASTTCLFTKTLSVICFFNYSPTYGILYVLLCLAHVMFLPKPVYQGPENIVYFRGPNLTDEIARDKRVTWVIAFYVAWSPKCVNLAPVFSELSNEYHLENLKFGKIDISRYPNVAEKYEINTGALSRQLPTIILFQDGQEVERRPIPTKHVTLKFDFTKVNIIKEFKLNEVYNQCKKALSARKKTAAPSETTELKKDK